MNQKYQVWTRDGHRELTREEWCNFDGPLLHRTDGPAWIYPDGTKLWYQNGQLHRVDGPALIFPDGDQYWYLNGQQLPTKDAESWIKSNGIDLNRLEDQLMFLTEWGSGWAN